MTLDAWNRYQSVPPLVHEEVLVDPETLALAAKARKLYGDDLQGSDAWRATPWPSFRWETCDAIRAG